MERKEEVKEVFKLETYPAWVKDDLDKVLADVIGGDKEYTFAQIKNRVLDSLIKKIAQGTTLNDRLLKLVEAGVLESRDKETKITLFKSKK